MSEEPVFEKLARHLARRQVLHADNSQTVGRRGQKVAPTTDSTYLIVLAKGKAGETLRRLAAPHGFHVNAMPESPGFHHVSAGDSRPGEWKVLMSRVRSHVLFPTRAKE